MATQLQIISTDREDVSVFNPVKLTDREELNSEFAFEIASIIQQYLKKFKDLGKMKHYQVKLYSDKKIKTILMKK